MDINLFVVQSNGRYFGYTKEMLEKAGWELVEGSSINDEKTKLVQQAYSKNYGEELVGLWSPFSTKEEWLEGDNQKVEAAITERQSPFVRHGERWSTQVAINGIVSWPFDKIKTEWTKTEQGFASMPLKLAEVIKDLTVADLYGNQNDPLFQTPSSES